MNKSKQYLSSSRYRALRYRYRTGSVYPDLKTVEQNLLSDWPLIPTLLGKKNVYFKITILLNLRLWNCWIDAFLWQALKVPFFLYREVFWSWKRSRLAIPPLRESSPRDRWSLLQVRRDGIDRPVSMTRGGGSAAFTVMPSKYDGRYGKRVLIITGTGVTFGRRLAFCAWADFSSNNKVVEA